MPISMKKDPSGEPAISLDKLPEDLQTDAGKAQMALNMIGLDGLRMEFYAEPDHSYSMKGDYEPPALRMQKLMKRVLAGIVPLDGDGKVPCIPWDSKLHIPKSKITRRESPHILTLDNYETFVADSVYKPRELGGTDLILLLEWIEKTAQADPDNMQGHMIFTDGQPDSAEACLRKIAEMSYTAENAWLKVMSLRPKEINGQLWVPFLDDADNMEERRPDLKRKRDNFACAYLPEYDTMPALAFYKEIYRELDTWTASF